MLLFRPVGMLELERIYEADMQAFPPRLVEQPIFYPVLNYGYAAQIARDWNTKSRSFAGYVTQFEVEDSYISKFQSQNVGAREHEELWIPAEELLEFNAHIVGRIIVTGAYFGPNFEGYIPKLGGFRGRKAAEQFLILSGSEPLDLSLEIRTNNLAVFLNYPFWLQHDFAEFGITTEVKEKTLGKVQQIWEQHYPEITLLGLK